MPDTVPAAAAWAGLPEAPPVGLPTSPRLPGGLRAGQAVTVTAVVAPDGRARAETIAIAGTDDPAYRRRVIEFFQRTHFRPAQLDGCATWSRTGFVTKAL